MAVPPDCRICQGEAFDREIGRMVVWSDRSWQLTTSLVSPILGSRPDELAAMADQIRTALA
jgi:hypothetical protein